MIISYFQRTLNAVRLNLSRSAPYRSNQSFLLLTGSFNYSTKEKSISTTADFFWCSNRRKETYNVDAQEGTETCKGKGAKRFQAT